MAYHHNRAWRRHIDWHHAIRKRNIVKYVYWSEEWYDNLHQYSCNKVHCSCGMCSRYRKTNNKGKRRLIHGNYAPSKNWSHTDERRIEEMENSLQDYLTFNVNSTIIITEQEERNSE